ncbi:hypothetical protein FISHEDRAFT_54961 [Fistulina hepatica ATCC 64428]|uniref:Uncharacterized protein n=1 Tax=Fistulina hepatica ATCC 64428 TaxID=1128425 RepID=A0A0D7AR14_9AGAR|nr:hypothetical protein FISHEDRAFT_54961 [Fistulina hepatica ATCC 64428]
MSPRSTVTAYALQLRSAFPASTPAAPTSDGSWKTHALALERGLKDLQAQLDEERTKNLVLTNTTADNSAPTKSKTKKAPFYRYRPPPRIDLVHVLSEAALNHSNRLPSDDCSARPTVQDDHHLLRRDSLIAAFSAFHELLHGRGNEGPPVHAPPPDLVLSFATRALEATHAHVNVPTRPVVLHALATVIPWLLDASVPLLLLCRKEKPEEATTEPPLGTFASQKTSAMSTACQATSKSSGSTEGPPPLTTSAFTILSPSLAAVEPTRNPCSGLVRLLDRLLVLVLAPLIRSVHKLSLSLVQALFPGPGNSACANVPADLRPDVLMLLRAILETLATMASSPKTRDDAKEILTSARETIAVMCLRELLQILETLMSKSARALPQLETADGTAQKLARHDASVTRLAVNDTLWFLCNVLHAVFLICDIPPGTSGQSKKDMLHQTSSRETESGMIGGTVITKLLCRIIDLARARPSRADNNEAEKLDDTAAPTDRAVSSQDKGASSGGAVNSGTQNGRGEPLLNEVGYDMLLGVAERYWQWSEAM